MAENKNVVERFVVNYPNGESKTFTKRTNPDGSTTLGKIFTASDILTDGFITKIYLSNGQLQQFSIDINNPTNLEFVLKVAARGAEELFKNAVTGISDFEPLFDEDGNQINKTVPECIQAKLEEFARRELTTRVTGVGSSEPVSIVERAYASMNGYDLSDTEDFFAVKAWYKGLSKAEKKAMKEPGSELFEAIDEIEEQDRQERKRVQRELHQQRIAATN